MSIQNVISRASVIGIVLTASGAAFAVPPAAAEAPAACRGGAQAAGHRPSAVRFGVPTLASTDSVETRRTTAYHSMPARFGYLSVPLRPCVPTRGQYYLVV